MKRLMTLALALALALCAATAGAVTLKLSEVHAEGYPTTLADQEFARLVEERTDGRIKIDVYSGAMPKPTVRRRRTGALSSAARPGRGAKNGSSITCTPSPSNSPI